MKTSYFVLAPAVLFLSCSTIAFGQNAPAARANTALRVPPAVKVTPGAAVTGALVERREAGSLSKTTVSRGDQPGLKQFRGFPVQNGRADGNWGHVLTDIVRHLPEKSRYQDAFRRYTQAGDLVTAGHEWTHFLNEHLSLQCGAGVSAYYLLDNNYVTLSDPEGLRGRVPAVPASLRGDLYQLYLVQNKSNARVDPLYLFDEWSAYANDVAVAVDQLNAGKPLNPFNLQAMQTTAAANVLEFTFYACAVGMAVKEHDPAYYASAEGEKLRDFIRWNARRSLELHRKASQRGALSRGDSRNAGLMSSFRSSADTAEMRAWVKSDLGEDLANLLMGQAGPVASGAQSPAEGG